MSLALKDIRADGLIGILRKVDQSFNVMPRRGYRATNRDGYLVDLMGPELKRYFSRPPAARAARPAR